LTTLERLAGTNSLAYYENSLIAAVKSVVTLEPGVTHKYSTHRKKDEKQNFLP